MSYRAILPDDHTPRGTCWECRHVVGYVSWWCVCQDSVEARGTAIPPGFGCKFWAAAPRVSEVVNSYDARWMEPPGTSYVRRRPPDPCVTLVRRALMVLSPTLASALGIADDS